MPDTRSNEQKAAEILAIRLELDPKDIYWSGFVNFEISLNEPYVLWIYETWVRDQATGGLLMILDESGWPVSPMLDEHTVKVPLELYQEFLNHKKHGTPN